MCSTASSIPRCSDMPDNITRSPSTPRLAKDGLVCATVSAKPSRSRAANHALARCGGAPTSLNLSAIGAMSDKVSFTSNTSNAGLREPLEIPGWSIAGIDSVNRSSSLLTPKGQRRCLDYDQREAKLPTAPLERQCAGFGRRNKYRTKYRNAAGHWRSLGLGVL